MYHPYINICVLLFVNQPGVCKEDLLNIYETYCNTNYIWPGEKTASNLDYKLHYSKLQTLCRKNSIKICFNLAEKTTLDCRFMVAKNFALKPFITAN